jgi:hypothetical protein
MRSNAGSMRPGARVHLERCGRPFPTPGARWARSSWDARMLDEGSVLQRRRSCVSSVRARIAPTLKSASSPHVTECLFESPTSFEHTLQSRDDASSIGTVVASRRHGHAEAMSRSKTCILSRYVACRPDLALLIAHAPHHAARSENATRHDHRNARRCRSCIHRASHDTHTMHSHMHAIIPRHCRSLSLRHSRLQQWHTVERSASLRLHECASGSRCDVAS